MKDGAPTITTDGSGLRVAVIAASWHERVMDGLLDGARRGLADAGVTEVDVVRVPGTFELPVACAALVERYDALVALGVVIRGGTPHFEYVCQAATSGIRSTASKIPNGPRRVPRRRSESSGRNRRERRGQPGRHGGGRVRAQPGHRGHSLAP